jgi:hypothetical protein
MRTALTRLAAYSAAIPVRSITNATCSAWPRGTETRGGEEEVGPALATPAARSSADNDATHAWTSTLLMCGL